MERSRDVGHGNVVLEAHPQDDAVLGVEPLHHIINEALEAQAGADAFKLDLGARHVAGRDGCDLFPAFIHRSTAGAWRQKVRQLREGLATLFAGEVRAHRLQRFFEIHAVAVKKDFKALGERAAAGRFRGRPPLSPDLPSIVEEQALNDGGEIRPQR